METRIVQIQAASPDDPGIHEAAALLQQGEIVAFPTETVYGLAGNALDVEAAGRIYETKGRPSNNPLIVHVADIAQARSLAAEWPPEAQCLACALWPGPLTLVLKKNPLVPDAVTGGGDTVAIRIPGHPVARALIHACGFPLAAPSANVSNYISPTTAAHVARGLSGKIPLILDGGPCESGIESTVLSLVGEEPVILRPGVFSANFLSELLQKPVLQVAGKAETSAAMQSPGQLLTHYAPHTPLWLVKAENLDSLVHKFVVQGKAFGLMSITPPGNHAFEAPLAEVVPMPSTPDKYARLLYATLHDLDSRNLEAILCELPPGNIAWAGIADRLNRAGKHVLLSAD